MSDIATERHSHAAFEPVLHHHDRQSVPCGVQPLHTGKTGESPVGDVSDVYLLEKQTPLHGGKDSS